MLKSIIATAVAAAGIAGGLTLGTAALAQGATAPAYPMCEYEDSNGCVWDARHEGNGQGRSFIATRTGRVIYIPHRAAHALTH